MDKDAQVKEKILNIAEKRMIKFGYRKVTMDEISQDLSMSKNTIYKHFASKIEMAEAIFRRLEKEINHELSLIEESSKDPLEIISKSIFFVQHKLAPWFEHFLGDIKFELPDLWQQFADFRNEKISEIKKLIEDGIQKGKFRKVNAALALQVYLGGINQVINPEFLTREKISFSDAIEGVLNIWSTGIVKNKDKGMSYGKSSY